MSKTFSAMKRFCIDHSTQWKFLYTMLILMKTPSLLWTDHNDHCTTSLLCKVKFKKNLWQMSWPQHHRLTLKLNILEIYSARNGNNLYCPPSTQLRFLHNNEPFNTLSLVDWPQRPLHHRLTLQSKISKELLANGVTTMTTAPQAYFGNEIFSAMVRFCTTNTLHSWSSSIHEHPNVLFNALFPVD